jgi:hypothetical protein
MIALFMDCIEGDINKNIVIRKSKEWDFPGIDSGINCRIEYLKYHYSWDWLMPVIEKISKIEMDDDSTYPCTFGMINQENGLFMFRFNRYPIFEHSLLITAAYFAVLNYIEHYNTLNQ